MNKRGVPMSSPRFVRMLVNGMNMKGWQEKQSRGEGYKYTNSPNEKTCS